MLYVQYVEPFFRQHEYEIEDFIGRAHERAKDLGFQYFYKAVDLFRENVLGLPPQNRAAPPPPATSYTGYAQSLLSRFNLPSAAGAAPAGDWLSSIGSSLTSMAPAGQSRDMYAPREVSGMSRADKMEYISTQRDQLGHLISELTREEMNMRDEDTGSDESGDGNGTSLRKNRSDHSFTYVNPEDVMGSSSTSTVKPASRWTSGWFGYGNQASTSAMDLDGQARSRA